jgi:hypothetical protein
MTSFLKTALKAAKNPLESRIYAYLVGVGRTPRDESKWGWPVVFSPSALSYARCERQDVLSRLRGVKYHSPVDPSDLAKMDLGTAVHTFWQNHVLGPMGILWGIWVRGDGEGREETREGFQPGPEWRYRELTVRYNSHAMGGHTDGLLKVGKAWVLLDIKTVGPWVFNSLPSGPPEHHVVQLQIYLNGALDADFTPDVQRGVLLYINRDSGERREVWIDRDPAVIAPILSHIENVQYDLAARVLPERVCATPREKQARECGACRICFAVSQGPEGFSEARERMGVSDGS